MRKRMLCLGMAIVLLISLLPSAAGALSIDKLKEALEKEGNAGDVALSALVDSEDCAFQITGYAQDEYYYTINVHLENRTDTELMFSIEDASVNGYMCDPFWADTVAAGKKKNAQIRWYARDLAANGVERPRCIEFLLRVYDIKDWDAEPYVEDVFTLYPEGDDPDTLELPAREPVEGELVLYEDERCAMTFTGYDASGDYGYGMQVYLENKTDKKLTFGLDNVSVNGYMCDPFWAAAVAGGKGMNDEIGWYWESFAENGIQDVRVIEFELHVYESDDWSVDDYVAKVLTVYPLGDDAESLELPPREPVKGEEILYEDENLRFIVTGYDPEGAYGYTMHVYIENKTGSNLCFALDDVSVNDYMCDPFWACVVAAGKGANCQIYWYGSSFESNGIEAVEKIEFRLNVYDMEDWSVPDYLDKSFTVNP